MKAPLLNIEERKPRYVVVSDCYVWRFLERGDLANQTGEVDYGRAAAQLAAAAAQLRTIQQIRKKLGN